MSITSIRDIIKTFAQSLQVSTIFPALLFVLVNVYFVLPMFIDFDRESVSILFVAASSSLMLSYLLYAFNFPLIRLLEGYKFRETWLMKHLESLQRSRLRRILMEIEVLNEKKQRILHLLELQSHETPDPSVKGLSAEWFQAEYRLAQLHRRKDLHFPSKEAAVLPTELGNVIAAFEDYPRNRYGIDSVIFWPRIVPILKKDGFLSFLAEEKTVFDFVLNTTLIVGVVGLELLYLNLFLFNIAPAIFWFIFLIIVIPVLHGGLVVAARQWGSIVRIAFDLYRHELHRSLGLVPQHTFEADFKQWQRVSSFIGYQQQRATSNDFYPSATMARLNKQKAT